MCSASLWAMVPTTSPCCSLPDWGTNTHTCKHKRIENILLCVLWQSSFQWCFLCMHAHRNVLEHCLCVCACARLIMRVQGGIPCKTDRQGAGEGLKIARTHSHTHALARSRVHTHRCIFCTFVYAFMHMSDYFLHCCHVCDTWICAGAFSLESTLWAWRECCIFWVSARTCGAHLRASNMLSRW